MSVSVNKQPEKHKQLKDRQKVDTHQLFSSTLWVVTFKRKNTMKYIVTNQPCRSRRGYKKIILTYEKHKNRNFKMKHYVTLHTIDKRSLINDGKSKQRPKFLITFSENISFVMVRKTDLLFPLSRCEKMNHEFLLLLTS